jgi:hypothetical protein
MWVTGWGDGSRTRLELLAHFIRDAGPQGTSWHRLKSENLGISPLPNVLGRRFAILSLAGRYIDHEFSRLAEVSRAFGVLAWSFRVALRSEPINSSTALHPVIKVGLARQTLDVPDFGAGTVGLDLPVAFRNAFRFEHDADSRGFAHTPEYDPFGQGRKRESGLPYSN